MTNAPAPAIIQPAATLDFERLADAIKREENSKRHPYGIMVDGLSEQEARQRCVLLCKVAWRIWQEIGKPGDFIDRLARSYCPDNWRSWSANVRAIYRQQKNRH